jgi:hypothetical protein
MRKVIVFLTLVFSVSSLAHAQQTRTASFFLSDVIQSQTDRRTEQWPGGFGVAFEQTFAQRWSVQGAVAVERHRSYPYVVEDDGSITLVDRVWLQTVPIDVTARYHWLNDTRWKPYLGLGAHYVAAPNADRRFRYQNHLDGEIGGGTLFMFNPAFGVMLDGRVLVGDREPYDQPFKVSLGVTWRF